MRLRRKIYLGFVAFVTSSFAIQATLFDRIPTGLSVALVLLQIIGIAVFANLWILADARQRGTISTRWVRIATALLPPLGLAIHMIGARGLWRGLLVWAGYWGGFMLAALLAALIASLILPLPNQM